ncbi:hypothetical protein [Streptosporangium amethystogenes]|nr:hypothetical protein [Streptosporangium amethystogenes]
MVALQPVCAITPAALSGHVYSAVPTGLAGSICTTHAIGLVSSYGAIGCV